jgi:predicted dehydrogenase
VKAAQAGKHVVCEKPCGKDAGEVREMLNACSKAGVQFMDGVMFMHSDRLPAMRKVLDDGQTVGQMKRIASQFSFLAPEDFLKGNIRVSSELEPLGCLGDLGWYTIRFSLWAMNYKMPHTVSGRILSQHGRADSSRPVPTEFSAELLFDGGVSASFYNSFITEHQCWANVSGTKGYLYLQDFVIPFFGNEVEFFTQQTAFVVDGCDFHIESHQRRHSVNEYANSHATSQETKLFRTFGERVLSGKVDPFWGDVALKTQVVMDACLASAVDGRPVTIES